MQVTKNGLTIEVPDGVIANLILERLAGNSPIIMPQGLVTPRLGEVWLGEGGIFLGAVRGIEGGRDYHLILGPECANDLNHPDAIQ